MKKRIPRPHLPLRNSPKSFKANTGEHCPANGWWVPADREGEGHFIAEGSIMPPDKERSITWALVTADLSAFKQKYAHPRAGAHLD